jgi:hypothetical protein
VCLQAVKVVVAWEYMVLVQLDLDRVVVALAENQGQRTLELQELFKAVMAENMGVAALEDIVTVDIVLSIEASEQMAQFVLFGVVVELILTHLLVTQVY